MLYTVMREGDHLYKTFSEKMPPPPHLHSASMEEIGGETSFFEIEKLTIHFIKVPEREKKRERQACNCESQGCFPPPRSLPPSISKCVAYHFHCVTLHLTSVNLASQLNAILAVRVLGKLISFVQGGFLFLF